MIGAITGGAVYSATAGGQWTWQNFGQSLEFGAISGIAASGISGGLSSAFGQNVAFSTLGNVAGYSAVTLSQGSQVTSAGLGGAFAGGLVGGAIPGYQGIAGSSLENIGAELGYSALSGAASGAVSGGVTGVLNNGNIGSEILSGVKTGAISGATEAGLQIAAFGSAFKPSGSAADALNAMEAGEGSFGIYGPVYRTGGLFGLIGQYRNREGSAVGHNLSIYSNSLTPTLDILHETAHYYQEIGMGYSSFIEEGLYEAYEFDQYLKNPNTVRNPYETSGNLEYQASQKAQQYAH